MTFSLVKQNVYQQGVYLRQNRRMNKKSYDRLLQAAKELKDWNSPSEVCAGLSRLGYEVSDQAMTNWKSRGVSKEGRLKASALIGCRPHWIETGDGAMEDVQIIKNVIPTHLTQTRIVPLIAKVPAGDWRTIFDDFSPGAGMAFEMASVDCSEHTFALIVSGDSMSPDFREGDRIIVDPNVSPRPGNFVIARNHNLEPTFKQYKARGVDATGKEIFELVPLNDSYSSIRSDEIELEIIGTVIEHRRSMR